MTQQAPVKEPMLSPEPQPQPASPTKACHNHASADTRRYSGDVHACKPPVHACTQAKVAATTQVLQLITAILGLAAIVTPWITQIM